MHPLRSPSAAGAIWLWGSVCGVSGGVIALLIGLLLEQVVFQRSARPADSAIQLLGELEYGLYLLCVVIASVLAGALSKRFISGVIAAVMFVLINQGLVLLISLATLLPTLSLRALSQLVIDRVVGGVVLLLLAALLGAGGGALGALLGRALARRSSGHSSQRLR
jgi:hypothetical protein